MEEVGVGSLLVVPFGRRRLLGMFVGGFSPKEPLPEAWEVNIHFDEKPEGVKRLRAPGESSQSSRSH